MEEDKVKNGRILSCCWNLSHSNRKWKDWLELFFINSLNVAQHSNTGTCLFLNHWYAFCTLSTFARFITCGTCEAVSPPLVFTLRIFRTGNHLLGTQRRTLAVIAEDSKTSFQHSHCGKTITTATRSWNTRFQDKGLRYKGMKRHITFSSSRQFVGTKTIVFPSAYCGKQLEFLVRSSWQNWFSQVLVLACSQTPFQVLPTYMWLRSGLCDGHSKTLILLSTCLHAVHDMKMVETYRPLDLQLNNKLLRKHPRPVQQRPKLSSCWEFPQCRTVNHGKLFFSILYQVLFGTLFEWKGEKHKSREVMRSLPDSPL